MMEIRRLRGLDEARAALLSQRGIEPEELPPALLERTAQVIGPVASAEEAVARVIAAVRERGDDAVRELTRAFDGADVQDLRVPDAQIEAAARRVSAETYRALEAAAERIRLFHERALRRSWLEA